MNMNMWLEFIEIFNGIVFPLRAIGVLQKLQLFTDSKGSANLGWLLF